MRLILALLWKLSLSCTRTTHQLEFSARSANSTAHRVSWEVVKSMFQKDIFPLVTLKNFTVDIFVIFHITMEFHTQQITAISSENINFLSASMFCQEKNLIQIYATRSLTFVHTQELFRLGTYSMFEFELKLWCSLGNLFVACSLFDEGFWKKGINTSKNVLKKYSSVHFLMKSLHLSQAVYEDIFKWTFSCGKST